VDGTDLEDKHDTNKEMERNDDTNDMEKNDVPAVPGVDLGLVVLQLRGSEEDRQGLLSDLDNMEIAWEDFILEEPGTTRALVQANLTTRALVQPPTTRPGSRKQSVTSRTSKASGDSNIIFSKVASGGEKSMTAVEDQVEPCQASSELSSKPCETDSGTVNPNFSENTCDQIDCKPPIPAEDQIQPAVVNLVNSKDDKILLPEVVKTLIPETEKTEN